MRDKDLRKLIYLCKSLDKRGFYNESKYLVGIIKASKRTKGLDVYASEELDNSNEGNVPYSRDRWESLSEAINNHPEWGKNIYARKGTNYNMIYENEDIIIMNFYKDSDLLEKEKEDYGKRAIEELMGDYGFSEVESQGISRTTDERDIRYREVFDHAPPIKDQLGSNTHGGYKYMVYTYSVS